MCYTLYFMPIKAELLLESQTSPRRGLSNKKANDHPLER